MATPRRARLLLGLLFLLPSVTVVVGGGCVSHPGDQKPCDDCEVCGEDSCPPLPDPAIVGLVVAGGQNAAFPADTFSLHTWYMDSTGAPMGVLPSGVTWSSSDSGIVEPVGGGFTARGLGTATLTAEAPVDGTVYAASREFHVIPSLEGRVAWLRKQPGSVEPFQLATMDLPGGLVRIVPLHGEVEALGPPALSPNGSRVAIQLVGYRGISLSRVYLVDLASGDVLPLADSVPGQQVSPRWSPDGADVLFAANPGGWNIWSAPAAGGGARIRLRLDWPSPVFFDASWSTERVVVELVDPATQISQLWHAVLDSGLAGSAGLVGAGPRVSPSGQRLAYGAFSAVDGNQIVVATGSADPDTLLPRILVPRDRAYRTGARRAGSLLGSWTGSDDFLVIEWFVDAWPPTEDNASPDGGPWSYLSEIYLVSADGRYRVRLTASPWIDAVPDFR